MPVFADRVKTTTSTTGSSTITLSASPVAGFQAFPSSLNGETVGYVIENGTSFEIGTGTYTHSGLTLTRTLRSSSTGSLLSLSGTSTVFLSPTYSDLQIVEFFSNTSDLPAAAASHGRIYHVHGEGAMYFAHGGAWYKLANATNATTSAAGLMSGSDKTKLDGVASSANNFTLPTASNSAIGGVRIGGNLSIDSNGILSSASTSASSANFSSTILADATAGQTVYSGVSYVQNREAVYVNGVKMLRGTDYTNNSAGNTITFATGLGLGDKVELVDHGALVAGTKVYATTTLMVNDTTNVQTGQLGFVSANSGLYIFNGSGWYLAETANTSPTISSVTQTTSGTTTTLANNAAYSLTSGASTLITIAASDPELNTTLSYAHAVTTGSLGSSATVTQGTGADVNKFTIAASSTAAGTFSITFTVSDGINNATHEIDFTLSQGASIQYLLIGGGGAGGSGWGLYPGSGGGSGGLRHGTVNYTTNQTFTLVVGSGGSPSQAYNGNSTNGTYSRFGNLWVGGGGGGATCYDGGGTLTVGDYPNTNHTASGPGHEPNYGTNQSYPAISTGNYAGQLANAGSARNSQMTNSRSGAGGGAGAAGTWTWAGGGNGAIGGAGYTSTITSASVTHAAGGDGGSSSTGGSGGGKTSQAYGVYNRAGGQSATDGYGHGGGAGATGWQPNSLYGFGGHGGDGRLYVFVPTGSSLTGVTVSNTTSVTGGTVQEYAAGASGTLTLTV